METISYTEFNTLCKTSQIVVWKRNLPSIIKHDTNLITKVFCNKKRFTSDLFYPRCYRFCHNAKKLLSRGVVAPKVKHLQKIRGTNIRLVTYEEIKGTSLRALLSSGKKKLDISKLVDFFICLHDKGIYFRSLHLGNIIMLESGGFGLIDLTDTSFKIRPLSLNMRARNLSFLLSYQKDMELLQRSDDKDIVQEYLKFLNVHPGAKHRFVGRVKRHLTRRLKRRGILRASA